MSESVYPLVFDPIYKPKVWGGDAFVRLFGRPLPPTDKIGESWELADLESDNSRVANGPLAGQSLHAVLERLGPDLLGHAQPFLGRFPLLIKFLDANEHLSVQVHPTQQVADRLRGEVRVKHEAWYILDCRPNPAGPAGIFVGCKPGVTHADLDASVAKGTTPELLNFLEVRPGQCFYLPSGTLHALGAGVVVAEVQTPSDVTYRLYDWGRQGRELHVPQTLECVDPTLPWTPQVPKRSSHGPVELTQVATCPFFIMRRAVLGKPNTLKLAYGEMVIWMLLKGRATLRWPGGTLDLTAGQTVVLPAALRDAVAEFAGPAEWLDVTLPR